MRRSTKVPARRVWRWPDGSARRRAASRTRPLRLECFESRCLLTTVVLPMSSADNTIFQESDNESNGAGIYFFVGKTLGTQDPPASLRRGLIKFDINSMVPSGATINSVSLQLNMSRTISAAFNVGLHRVLADWGEGTSDAALQEGKGAPATANDATWQYRFYNPADPTSSPAWATPGGAFQAVASATTSVAGVGNYVWSSAQMVADVQAWVNTPTSQFGWLLKHVDEATDGTAKRFNSRQNTSGRPQLTIDYTAAAAPTLAIAATSAVKAEGNAGSTAFTFTVTRSGDTSGASAANYAVTGSGGNPAAAGDFTGGVLPSGTVNFTAGQTSQVITINVSGDATIELDEGFTVTLSGATGATISTATAAGTIQNDDVVLPTLAIAATSAVKPEGSAGSTAFTFTVSRSGDTSGASAANYAVMGSGGNPAAASDFTGGVLPSGTVNFTAGQTSQLITINVSGDAAVELDEGFTVTLSGATGATISTATAAGTIQNDDVVLPTLAIAATSATKAEGNAGSSAFTFTVTRSGDTSGASAANYAVTGSTANPAAASDFTGGVLPGGTVNFTAGQTSQVITINVSGDATVELDEGFTVTLSGATGATIGTATATGTIQNDDAVVLPTLAIAATSAVKAEGNAGSTAFTFTVTRSGDTSGASAANYAVTGSGANPAAASDFTGGVLPGGTVNFTAGQTSQVITINVSGDATVELDEGFTVTLSGATGATISTATATGTIQNDDAVVLPTLAIAATSAVKAEGNAGSTAFTFTVTRSGDTSGASAANYAVTGSTANPAAASDFTGGVLPSGTVNFTAGQTSQVITINVSGDATVELDEGFTVTLSGATGATIGTATATGTIQNDDAVVLPTLAIAATSAVKAEGNAGSTAFTFTVTRSGDTSGASAANYAVTGSGANPAAASDFTGGVLPGGTVNFTAGQTSQVITINVSGDATVELDEGFTVTLSGATGATISTATAAGTIQNDDAVVLPTLAIAATSATKAEGNAGSTAFTFTVTRSGDTSGVSAANYAVTGSGGNPAAASDFTGGVLPSGTVNFTAGQTSQVITINVSGDATVELDEGFTVTLSGATGATISTATAAGTIQNDDVVLPTLAIAATSAVKPEGNAGSTAFTFTVTRSGDTSGASAANYAVTGSGANPAAASDFTGGVLPSGTANFTAGQTSQVITINVSGDAAVELDEGFTVTLSGATGATISTATAAGTIQNDDAVVLPTLAIAATSAVKAEGNAGSTAFTFTVTRSGDTSGASAANYAVTGSTANPAAASDFTGGVLPGGTVNFMAGQTSQLITINVSGDALLELEEGFTVTLSGATGATISTATAMGAIQNDDVNQAPTLDAIANPAAILEDAGLVVINLAGISAGPGETQTLTVTAVSSNPGLIPHPTVSYASPSPNGSLSYTPLANQAGTAVITVTVMDNGGTASGGVDATQRTFTVNVTPVNDPPTISNIADRTTPPGTSTGPVPFLIGDVETAPAVLNVTVQSSNLTLVPLANIVLGGSGPNRTLTVTPAASQLGSATITVTVTDAGGAAVSDAFVLLVAQPHPWQNPVAALNVDGQPGIVPLDALIIFNEINNRLFSHPATGLLPAPFGPFGPPPFYDVNGDDHVTAIDALLIFNELNKGEGEGEGGAPAAAADVLLADNSNSAVLENPVATALPVPRRVQWRSRLSLLSQRQDHEPLQVRWRRVEQPLAAQPADPNRGDDENESLWQLLAVDSLTSRTSARRRS